MTKEQGLSLLDIGPLTEKIDLGDGKHLEVNGISTEGIFLLLREFPELQGWFMGRKISVETMADKMPKALAAIIAAGCGHPGEEKAIENAKRLPAEIQLNVLEAIGRITFRSGFGPFVERIIALSGALASAVNSREPDTNSPKTSNTSSPTDTTSTPSGS